MTTERAWMTCVWIGLGGGLGSVARYVASGWVARHFGETFPWGTLLVNVTGSFLIGLFAVLTAPDGRWLVPAVGRQCFMIGVLGGYTTFSSFSLQTLNLAQGGEWGRAIVNVLLSMLGCLLAVWFGALLGAQCNVPRGG
jgi:CrcB protein